MGMQASASSRATGFPSSALTVAGAGTLVVAALLYFTETSRAVAVWITPVGLVALALGILTLRGVRAPRWLLVALAVVVVALVVLGVATLVYSAAHPPTPA